jgi:hypothetical protein
MILAAKALLRPAQIGRRNAAAACICAPEDRVPPAILAHVGETNGWRRRYQLALLGHAAAAGRRPFLESAVDPTKSQNMTVN